jgi:hypothetical protein
MIRGWESFILKRLTNLVISAVYSSNCVSFYIQQIGIQATTKLTTSLYHQGARCISRRYVWLPWRGKDEDLILLLTTPKNTPSYKRGILRDAPRKFLKLFIDKLQDLSLFFPYTFCILIP